MLLLPKKIGPFTLQRKLGTGGIAESYAGTHDNNGGRPVVVRRVLPYVLRDPSRLASIEGRVKDLLGVRHPFLVHLVEHVAEGEEHFIVEEYIDGVSLDKVLAWCRQNQRQIPHNVFLNIATQVCNGLEALHGRTGKGTSAEHVLHLALKPGAIFVTRDGKVMLGSFGLTRSPTTLPNGGVAGPVPTRMEYLSPEQTHPDQKLTPASDIFALGAVLYELLTLDALFRADSNLQTIHRVRRAEVTTQLLRVKELMPGLDKVLYRALSLNPRHRYQRAFVLREDLRGLMAGYSFATIAEDTRTFLAPLFDSIQAGFPSVDSAPDAPAGADSFAETPITHVDLDPTSTAAFASQALAERAARERAQLEAIRPEDAGEHTEHTENTSTRGEDPPTEMRDSPLVPAEDLDRPTLPGEDLEAPPPPAPATPTTLVPDPTASVSNLTRPAPMAPIEAPILPPTPMDTAAFLAPGAEPLPPSPPAAPPPVALPPAGFSRAMPGPGLSRPMPPPVVPPKATAAPPVLPPKPMTPPPIADVPPPPQLFAPEPVAAPPAPPPPPALPPAAPPPRIAAAPPPAPRPTPAPPPAPSVFDEEPPPANNNRSLLIFGGAAVALMAMFSCAGLAWFGVSRMNAGSAEVADATPAADAVPAPATPGADAASVMAGDVPRLEPIEDDAVADAAPATPAPSAPPTPAPAPAAPAPAPTPVASAPPEPARPAPVATPTPVSAPATTARSTPTSSPTTTATRTPERTSSGASSTPAVASSPRYTPEPVPAPAPVSRPVTTTTTAKAEPTRTTETTSRTAVSRTAPPSAAPAFEPPPVDVSVEETPVSDLDQYVDAAKKGKLQSTDTTVLEMVDISEPNYTRARALLLMNAQRKSDDKATRKYLDELMLLPENQYNPVYLTDYARWHVNHGEYDKALEKASLAERYWARIPPEMVFSKKAEIYEIQAASYQGKFYKSDEDMELLASAIKGWERYRQHAATKSRTDLQKRADAELAKLQDIREKLQ